MLFMFNNEIVTGTYKGNPLWSEGDTNADEERTQRQRQMQMSGANNNYYDKIYDDISVYTRVPGISRYSKGW